MDKRIEATGLSLWKDLYLGEEGKERPNLKVAKHIKTEDKISIKFFSMHWVAE